LLASDVIARQCLSAAQASQTEFQIGDGLIKRGGLRGYGFLQGHAFVIASANNIAAGICRFSGTSWR
jgi:hypothetical protein